MTNSNSIQDVLFFPQMRPEKKVEFATEEDYLAEGIPAEWVPVIQKAGVLQIEALKELKPGKFYNDIMGLKKKMKLDIKIPTQDEVKSWIEG